MNVSSDHARSNEVNPNEGRDDVKILNVKFQTKLNLVVVRGSSVGDHSAHKYQQLSEDVTSHFKSSNSLNLYFNFDFLDSAALAHLASIIALLNEFYHKGKTIKLFWSCLSLAENVIDDGEKLKTLCEFEFYQ